MDDSRRRIFFDDSFDLYVWFDDQKAITGFQICYGEPDSRKALTWIKKKGYSHNSIDTGDLSVGKYKASQTLIRDGQLDKYSIIQHFQAISTEMDQKIRAFILDKLNAYQ